MKHIEVKALSLAASAAKIAIPENRISAFEESIDSVLSWIAKAHEVDSSMFEPLYNINSDNAHQVLRGDKVLPMSSEAVLSNAKTKKLGYFLIPKVIEK